MFGAILFDFLGGRFLSSFPRGNNASMRFVRLQELKAQYSSRAPIKTDSDSVKASVGALSVFLASPGAQQITGQNFVVDGGASLLG